MPICHSDEDRGERREERGERREERGERREEEKVGVSNSASLRVRTSMHAQQ